MQMAVCQLAPDQGMYCEAGKFLWKTTNVTMETRLGRGPAGPSTGSGTGSGAGAGGSSGGAGGGFLQKALATATEVGKRVLAGESVAFQHYRSVGGGGLVAFAGVGPGEMRAFELDGTTGWLAEKDAFVAAENTVDFDIAFTGFKTGR